MIINAETIKQNTDIESVLEYCGITLDSRNSCPCPIHGGKDNNFSVKNNIARCWSQCGGRHWDAVGFLQDFKACTYPEALEMMASISRIPVEYRKGISRDEVIKASKKEKEETDFILKLNERFQQYCWMETWGAGQEDTFNFGIVNVDGRTWCWNTIKKFGLCFHKNGYVQKSLVEEIGSEKLLLAGLLKTSEKGVYESFYNRILFPIRNHIGKLVGFTGRKTKDDDNPKRPKYSNSPETKAFRKREILYGLHENYRQIRKAGFAYLVEGQTDVITMFEYGLDNAVASSGTALTKEQCKLLKRYTSRIVLLTDGDEAGLKAALRNTEILIEAGIDVKVLLFPGNDDDPDSFLRQRGRRAFDGFKNSMEDAVIWSVMRNYSDEDLLSKELAYATAVNLLSKIDSETRRNNYMTELCKKKYLGSVKTMLKAGIEEQRTQSKPKRESSLTMQQQQDVIRYGCYIDKNKYYICSSPDGGGYEVSNFAIYPIMLVRGSNGSKRIVEVANTWGKSFISDIDSDCFVDFSGFKKVVEGEGNYLFYGKPEHFMKLKTKIYAEMETCYPITTLGYHRTGKFWAWGNGITHNNNFHPVNEYGIVKIEGTHYYLPAFSKVNALGLNDDDAKYEDEKKFILNPKTEKPTIKEWSGKICEVYGDHNGRIAVGFYVAALFRDIIFSRFNFFPHLNMFGPSGSGKSYLAWSLMYMFGEATIPFHLEQGTSVGFFRSMAQFRNALTWMDEYSNGINFKRVEALKGAYDGSGRVKGKMTNDNQTTRTTTNSAIIMTGQQQPTQDIALFKRCISLNFARTKYTVEERKNAEALREQEKTKCFAHITANIQQYRDLIAQEFYTTFDELRTFALKMLKGKNIEDRILNNHLIPVAAMKILSEKEEFGFRWNELLDVAVENIIIQSASIFNEDEVSIWWRAINYFIEKKMIVDGSDFIIKYENELTVKIEGTKKTHKIALDSSKQILFIRFTVCHPEYDAFHRQRHGKPGLGENALKYYLKITPAFLGVVKAKKFKDKIYSCYAFDLDQLPLELGQEDADNNENW